MLFAGVMMLAVGGRQAPAQPEAQPLAQSAARTATLLQSPRNANYRISARLDPAARTITASETLTWRNISANATSTLQFHLYYNAWRDGDSTWLRESARSADGKRIDVPPEEAGSIDVSSLRVLRNGAASDLTPAIRFIAPDDGNAKDRTVIEVALGPGVSVGPGEAIDVQIAWRSHVPRTFARTGARGNFFFIGQWFPKIGVLEDAGWNCHQFHLTTEFFADFGTYDVELTVPSSWPVGATGIEQSRKDNTDGTATHRYVQEDVHDFAWTTSPDYIERRERFEHPALPPVEMRLLLQPEHLSQAERHFAATRAALKSYGQWFGPYPYGHITIVDPAWQSGADGMEYPTLFTAGTHLFAPANWRDLEEVTVHETGHQFWYGIVASNEFEHAWMDEGLNQFSTARAMEAFKPDLYAESFFGGLVLWTVNLPVTRENDRNGLPWFRQRMPVDAQSTPSFRYWSGSSSALSYAKTALWLHTLERMIGWETLQPAMSTYFSRYAFKHPGPQDFFATVNQASGQDLTWFFQQVNGTANVFDYSIELLTSEPAAKDMFHTTVVVRRLREGIFPVDVVVTFENGERQQWRWDGRESWKTYEADRPVRAVSAEVDPDRVLLLDTNVTNNSVTLQPQGEAAARKWSLAWLLWLQGQLLTYGFFV